MTHLVNYDIANSKLVIYNSDGSISHEEICTLDEARSYLRENLNATNPLMEHGGFPGSLAGVVKPPRT